MLNGLLNRIAVAVSVLWLLLVGVMLAFTDATISQFFLSVLLVGVLPVIILIALSFLIQWILGPIGRWGAQDRRYRYYEILDD